MQKEAAASYEYDEIAKKIIDVTESMNKKLDEILKRVVKGSRNEFSYIKMIFLSSIIYPTTDFSTADLNNQRITNKEGRIKYIKYILSILR